MSLPASPSQQPLDAAAPDSEHAIQQVLEERARIFAQRSSEEDRKRHTKRHRALVVGAGDEQFGLALSDVLQIARGGHVTPLPGSPPALAGITNFRGAVYSVMDLAQILTGAANPDSGWLVFLRTPVMRLAFRVSSIESIVTYEQLALLEAAPQHLAGMIAPGIPLIDMSALIRHSAFTPGRQNPL